MKRTLILTGAVLLLIIFSTATAQSAGQLRLVVAPELSFALSPEAATDYYSQGFGYSMGFEFVATSQLSLLGVANYVTFSPDESAVRSWWTYPGEYPGSTNINVSEGTLDGEIISLPGKGSLRGKGS